MHRLGLRNDLVLEQATGVGVGQHECRDAIVERRAEPAVLIDDVSVWERALSAQQVEALFNGISPLLVSGYTDDRPISSDRYRSNWDLSAARAVSVVHELVMNRQVPADRVVAAGRAETNPLAPNDSPENRALNRRVEIAIRNPECNDDVPTGDLPVEIMP